MQKFLRTLMLAVLMLPFASQAQELTVHDGTTTNGYVPVYGFYADAYLRSQFVYPANELSEMAGGSISSMTFYASEASVDWGSANFEVKMTEISGTSLSAFDESASTSVFTGSLSISNNQMTVTFTTPYTYNGGNLLVEVDNLVTGTYVTSTWLGETVTGASVQGYSYSAFSSISGSQRNFLPKTTFTYEAGGDITCSAVRGLSLIDSLTTSSSLTFNWVDTINASGTSYTIYQINGTDTTEFPGAVITTTANGYSAFVSGLDPMTTYTFGVKANCGADGMSAMRSVSGRTACAPYQLPFIAYFEATVDNDPCWSGATGMSADSVFNGGVLTLTTPQWTYASSDNSGIEAGHYYKNIYGTSCKAWMITPEIDLSNASAPQLSFDVALTKYNSATLPEGDMSDDKFMVLISTDGGATWPAANATKWQSVGGDTTYSSLASLTYQNKVIDLTQYVGQTIRVAFYGESTVSGADNNMHIDNVIVGEAPSCDAITNLAVGNIFGRTADLTWSGSANSYEVEYKQASSNIWTSVTSNDTTATLTGLAPQTAYNARVTAVCSDGSSYPSPAISFTTKAACQVPTNLTVAALAREATLTWRDTIANAWQIQYISGTGADADTSEIEDLDEATYTMFNLTPETSYKFRVRANCGDEDGVSTWTSWKNFTTPAACQVPAGLTVTLTPGNGTVASISWTDTLASSWQLMLNGDSNNLIDVYETSYEFDTLTPEATYTINVRANCDNDGYSLWSTPVVFTPTNAYTVTVNDGTNTNSYVPIYGLYVDDHIQSRFIIPASSIAAMQYGSITKLTFYSSDANVNWGSAEFEVYMSTTSDTAVTVVNEVDDMTQVFAQGNLSIVDHQMVVTLNQPFQYMGDNLLIAFEQPTSGSYVSSYWYGVTVSGASMGGYGSSVSQQNFRPKMTFAFEPGEAPTCEVPTNLVCTDTTGHTATFTWESSASNTYVEYKETSAPATAWVAEAASSPYTLTDLAHSTAYNVRVRVDCDEDSYYSNTVTILTKNTCVDPTNLVVMPVEGSGSSVLVSWTDTMASEWELFTMLNGDTTQLLTVFDSDTTGGYLVQNLIPEARYSVWVRAICDETQGDISQWVGTNFTPTASVRTTLGTPETTNSYLPTYTFYNYSFTEQIYTAAEMGVEAGVITAVDFMNTGSQITRDLDIYMVHTSDSVFEDATSWVSVTAADKVFSGEVTFEGGSEWTGITFDTPFNYDGESNVVLVVDDNTGSYVSSVPFSVYTAAGQAIRIYSDDTDYEPTDPDYTGTLMNLKNHIRFAVGEPPACAKPTNVTLTSLGVTDATLTWNDTVASSWQIMVNGDATNLITTTTTTYTFTNLTANTNYTVNVRAVCSAEEISEWSTPVTFRTYAPAAAVPYSTGFEAGEDDAWVFRNGGNAWMIGNATHNGTGTNALYISQNGTANTYNTGSAAISYAFRTLDVTTPGAYYCAFDWKANGEGNYDFIRAWLVPLDSLNARANVLPDGTTTPYNYQNSTPAGWIDLGGKMNGKSSWQEAVNPANITVAGTYALVFMWANDGSGGSNPPAAVDNIWFGIPTCPVVTVAGVDSASRADSVIYFSWTPGGSETAWAVQYGTNVDTVSTPEYALQHIQGDGNFTINVRALCSDEDQSFWKQITGKLPCTPDTVPFLNDFDNLSGTFTNSCWGIGNSAGQVQDGYQNWPYCIAFTGASNDQLLFLNKGAYVILPDLNVPLNQLYLSFDFSSGADSSVLYLGYASCTQVNFEKVVFFDTLYHVDYATEAEFRGRVEMMLNNLPDEAHNLVIASDLIGTGYYVGLNELNLTLPPACGNVENVVATPVNETSATLSWTPSSFGTAQSYIVEYGPRLFTPGTGTVVTTTTNSITINGLTPATPYQAYIVTDCGTDTSEGILPVAFAGACGTLSVPDTFTFSEYMMSGRTMTDVMPNCWAVDSASRIYSEDSTLAQVYGYNSNSEMVFLMYDQAVVALPAVNKPLDSLMLTFDMQIADASMALVVGAVSSQANGFGSTFEAIDTLYSSDNGTVTSYLVNYNGNYQYIAFKNIALDTTVDASYVIIDNLVISMAPTCLPVVDLRTIATTVNSVTIDWESVSNDAPVWEVAYAPAGATITTNIMVTSHPLTLQNLDTNTAYNIQVRPICSASDTAEWCDVFVAYTDVCVGYTMRNFTNSDATSSYSPIGYSLYNYSYVQTIIDSADMAAIYGAPINTIGFTTNSNDGGTQFNNMHIYLANISESNLSTKFIKPDSTHTFVEVFNGGSLNYTEAGTHYFSFDTTFTWDGHSNVLVAVNRLNGNWQGTPSFAAHNATTNKSRYVYTDDNPYNINTVTGGTATTVVGNIILLSCDEEIVCEAPEVTITDVTENSVSISIAGNATNYEVVAMEGNWNSEATGITISDTSYTFNDLNDGMRYYIGVRSVCAADAYSNWTVVDTMTVEHPCIVPTNLTANDITLTGATLSWTAGEEGQSNFELRITGPNYDDTVAVTDTTYTVNNLYSNTTYNFYVRAICTEENMSEWAAATAPFTTLTCATPDQPTVSNITPYAATISWTAPENASGNYQIEYGFEDFNQGYGTLVSVNGAVTFNITGLTANRNYDVYVRSNCATGVNSDWSTKATFHTPNADTSVTYYTVTANVNDPTMGTVNGAGQYQENATATLTAVANDGYHFVNWNTGDTTATISFTVTGDVTYTAYFEANPVPQYTITVVANDSTMGTVTGSGTYDEGTVITLGATANIGYHFVNWSTGETTASINVTVTEDATYTAYFAENDTSLTYYMVTANVNDSTMGYVNGAGQYEEGTIATLTAVANNGYRFLNWSNGETTATITFSVTEDVTLTAYFEAIPTYTLTVNVNNAAMGRVNGIPEGPVVEGTQVTLTAVANTGYQFDNWSTGETTATITVTVNSDMTITANFSTVGIDDVATTAINMYPNPATNFVTLTGIEGTATVTVVDMNGRENGKWTVTNGELTIDVTDLAQGAYFVRIMGEQVNAIRKLIVR